MVYEYYETFLVVIWNSTARQLNKGLIIHSQKQLVYLDAHS